MSERQEKYEACEEVIMWARRIQRAIGPDTDIRFVFEYEPMTDTEDLPPNKFNQCEELIKRAKIVNRAARKHGVNDIPFTTNEIMRKGAERAQEYAARKKGEIE